MSEDAERNAFEGLPEFVADQALLQRQWDGKSYVYTRVQGMWDGWQAKAAQAETAQAAPTDDTTSREQYRRMFIAACEALGLVNEALGLDSDDGGAEPILAAIRDLKAAQAAPVVLPLTAAQVGELVDQVGYSTAEDRANFINGIRWGERAHGIATPGATLPAEGSK